MNPCASINYLHQILFGITSDTSTSSTPVELVVLIFVLERLIDHSFTHARTKSCITLHIIMNRKTCIHPPFYYPIFFMDRIMGRNLTIYRYQMVQIYVDHLELGSLVSYSEIIWRFVSLACHLFENIYAFYGHRVVSISFFIR